LFYILTLKRTQWHYLDNHKQIFVSLSFASFAYFGLSFSVYGRPIFDLWLLLSFILFFLA